MTDKKRPTHKVFAILPRGGENDKNFWVEIGAGWENADGSINIQQELMPRDPSVTLQIRPVKEEN